MRSSSSRTESTGGSGSGPAARQRPATATERAAAVPAIRMRRGVLMTRSLRRARRAARDPAADGALVVLVGLAEALVETGLLDEDDEEVHGREQQERERDDPGGALEEADASQ